MAINNGLPVFPADFVEAHTNPKFPELDPPPHEVWMARHAERLNKLAEKLMVAKFAGFNGINGVGAQLTKDIELAYRAAALLIEYQERTIAAMTSEDYAGAPWLMEKHAFREGRQ